MMGRFPGGLYGLLAGIFFMLSIYFSYHAFYGYRGYYAWKKASLEVLALKSTHDLLNKDCEKLIRKIEIMRDHIDPDLLEQQAWILFRRIDPYKRVLLYKNSL